MRLELKVTHTPNSKSKRPWERWTWLGSKLGSVLLLDQERIKVLNLNEKGLGVKKKVTKLSNFQNSAVVTNTTRDGQFLVGYLKSGDIFIWNKEQDTLRTVKGPPSINASTWQGAGPKHIQIYASDGAADTVHNILLVRGHHSVFLWEIDQSELGLKSRDTELRGTWSLIGGGKTPLPGADSNKAVADAQFVCDPVLGRCCLWSVVFYRGDDIHISTALIRWFEPWQLGVLRHPSFSVRWFSANYSVRSLSPSSWPLQHHGALAASYSNSGRVLAVAINQRSPHEAKMMFVSPLTAATTVVDMKSCGCKAKHPSAELIKTYWVSAMSWSHNDLFLVCITKRGSVAVLPRLGEPMLLQAQGHSVEHPPAFFLPLLSLITVAKPNNSNGAPPPSLANSPNSEENDEGRQRFSISCHPSNPIILCSDGYLGLILEFPANLTCASIVSDYLSEGATALSLMYTARDMGPVPLGSLEREPTSPNLHSPRERTFSNMMDMLGGTGDPGLESTRGSSMGVSYKGQFGNMTSGKIFFGETTNPSSTQSLVFLPMGNHSIESLIQWTQVAALCAWGLGASHAGSWNGRLEYLTRYTIQILVALFRILLRDDDTIELPKQTQNSISGTSGNSLIPKLNKVLSLYKAILVSALWDSLGSNSMYSYFRLTRSLVRCLLKGQICEDIEMTKCCIAILRCSEHILTRVYSRIAVSEPSFSISELSFHPSDAMEPPLVGQRTCNLAIAPCNTTPDQSARAKAARQRSDSSTSEKGGKKRDGQRDPESPSSQSHKLATRGRPLSNRDAVVQRLIPIWKRLYMHINRLLGSSTQTTGVSQLTRRDRQLIQLLCHVQRKLHLHGYSIPFHLHSKWTGLANKAYLKGCECYIKNLPERAIQFWQLAIADHQLQSQDAKRQTIESATDTPTDHTTQPPKIGKDGDTAPSTVAPGSSSGEEVVEASLLGILYTNLVCGNLLGALQLVDSLITCQNVGSVTTTERKGRRLPDMPRKDKQKLPPAAPVSTPVYVPFLAHSCQQRAVQSLARFMSLYFTNRPLFVFPPCCVSSLPPLHVKNAPAASERRIQVTHADVAVSVRQQDLSDRWTVESALNLLLVSGLVPEAVWLAHELGDWKSAFTLAVVFSSQVEGQLKAGDSSILEGSLVLPPSLSPTNLLKEGLNSVLQTQVLEPQTTRVLQGGKNVQRAVSFSGSQRRASYTGGLLDPPAMPLRKSSSVCSLVEEDKMAQVMLSQTLTDILTAATMSGQDPAPWLLGSMMEECLTLARGFDTLVPEEFYLPAPPYYCPQPEYIPNDSDPMEVLEEDDRRREVNDLVQLLLLVLNASYCSLPCARWYVEQLREVQQVESRWKKETPAPMPNQLLSLLAYPVDVLAGSSNPEADPEAKGGNGVVLECFRNLCCLLWMLYVRDKLSLSIRKYQTSKERSLQVKQPADSAEHGKTEKLLKSVLEWAECLHPFSRFLHLENEVNDIILTAIAELPLTKDTVSILSRHFYDINNLPPFLEEKFARLKEKLKRVKVAADQKKKKKKTEADAGNGEKQSMTFETLMTHYKRQSKRRRLELENRKASFGSLDDSIFNVDETRSKASSGKATAEARTDNQAQEGQRPQKYGTGSPFEVGSREFEGNTAYHHFLETLFLVTFGGQVQDDLYMAQTELPLIWSFHKQVLDSEFKKSATRIQQKSRQHPLRVEQLNRDQVLDLAMTADTSDSSLSSKANGTGLFRKNMFGNQVENHPVQIPRVPLKRCGSFRSLQEFGVDTSPGFSPRGSSKRSLDIKIPLKQPKRDTTFLTLTESEGFKHMRLDLGEDYNLLTKLLEWLTKWSGRKPSKGLQILDNPEGESKAVMQVKLPKELIVLSVWLLKNIYHSDAFEAKEESTSYSKPKKSSGETKEVGTVRFSRASKHTSRRELPSPGRAGSKRVSTVQMRDRTRHGSGGKKSLRHDDHLPIRDTSPVRLSRQISVRDSPPIVVESSSTSDESRELAAADIPHEDYSVAQHEGNGTVFKDSGIDNNQVVHGKPGRESKKKHRKLPQVTEEKKRASSNINQLLKEKLLPSRTKKEKYKGKSLSFHSDQTQQPSNLSMKKRSNSDASCLPDLTELEMSNLQGIANERYSGGANGPLGNHPEAFESLRPNGANIVDARTEIVSEPQTYRRSTSDAAVIHSSNPNTANNNSNHTRDYEARRRPSVDIITQSVKGGGILGDNVHVYSDASSSSPDVSSLEDSDEFMQILAPTERTKSNEAFEEVLDSVTK